MFFFDWKLVIRTALFATIIFLFLGCATTKGYQGSSLSNSQLAVVRAHGVRFHEVNGIEISSLSSGVVIPQGENTLKLSIDASNFNSPGNDQYIYTLVMTAVAGQEYAVTSKRGHSGVCAYPIQTNNGTPNFATPAGCIKK